MKSNFVGCFDVSCELRSVTRQISASAAPEPMGTETIVIWVPQKHPSENFRVKCRVVSNGLIWRGLFGKPAMSDCDLNASQWRSRAGYCTT